MGVIFICLSRTMTRDNLNVLDIFTDNHYEHSEAISLIENCAGIPKILALTIGICSSYETATLPFL